MPEGLAPISSSRIATGDIARHSFAVVRRGFDTDEVRAYLQSVARSIEALEEREQELRGRAHRGRGAGRPPRGRRGHPHRVARAAQRAGPAPCARGGSPHRCAGPGAAPPPCCGTPRARSTSCRRAPRPPPPNAWSRSSCWWRTRRRRPVSRASASSPRRWRTVRRSSRAPRTRGGPSSSRCKRQGAVCWRISPRDGAGSGYRSSSCGPPATRWPPPCTASATGWTGSWPTWIGPTRRHAPPRRPSVTSSACTARVRLPTTRMRGTTCQGRSRSVAGSEATEGGDVAGEDEGDHTGAPAAAPSVDELFARIRAGSESGAAAPEGDADDTVAVAAVEAAAPAGDEGGTAEANGEADTQPTEAEAPPGPDRRAHRPAGRAARARPGAAHPHGQACARRQSEPVARPAAQRTSAERRRAPRTRGGTRRRVRHCDAGPPGGGLQSRSGVRRARCSGSDRQ